MNEIWKDIIGYEGYYQVSNRGDIKSLDRHITMRHRNGKTANHYLKSKYLVKTVGKRGYEVVHLCKLGKPKIFTVHTIVAKVFIPNPENKPQVNHKNGIRTDNRVSNLEWCTNQENTIHSYKELNRVSGMKGKRNTYQSKRIKQMDLDGNLLNVFNSAKEASRKIKISHEAICYCARGVTKTSGGFKWEYY